MSGWRGLSAQEFYALRDARTELEVSSDLRLKAKLHLSIDEKEASTLAGQACFLLLVNLSARWCRDICISAPTIQICERLQQVYVGSNLQEAAILCAVACDPFGSFSVDVPNEQRAGAHVGVDTVDGRVSILGRGWLAFIGEHVRIAHGDAGNALGGSLAACLGASIAFRAALGDTELPEASTLSLWNLGSDSEALDGPPIKTTQLGRIAIIGVGAIGASIAHFMPLAGTRYSQVDLIDEDTVDYSNLNRIPLFFADDVCQPGSESDQCNSKVEIIRLYLQRNGMESVPFRQWFVNADTPVGNYDLIVLGANEYGVQRELMVNYPPLVIGASTGANWDVYFQRHIPLREDCPECRLPTPNASVPLKCAEGEMPRVNSADTAQTGALPFLSVIGALMVVAEIEKLADLAEFPVNENYAMMSLRTDEFFFVRQPMGKKANCSYCWNEAVFKKVRENSRFFGLSEVSQMAEKA